MSQDLDPGRKAFPLRLDPGLYAELRRWADAELRSVNGQIEFLLRRAVAERLGREEAGTEPGVNGGVDQSEPSGERGAVTSAARPTTRGGRRARRAGPRGAADR